MIRRVAPAALSIERQVEIGTAAQRQTVDDIVQAVRECGDDAVRQWTAALDGVELAEYRVAEEEIARALQATDAALLRALQEAAERIRRFHERQRRTSWIEPEADGTVLGQLVRPLETVGVYVPGGRAAYPSSVLMSVIPARVAGVQRIVMVTPPHKDGSVHAAILAAAHVAGVSEIYKVGGAQAVAALAFGTATIPRVDKIVGPGNIYVTLAKRAVFGTVAIDMIAGPSEIVVFADETADPVAAAADMLSQAEHDPLASAVLVTTSAALADAVEAELSRQCRELARADIAAAALRDYGAICVAANEAEAIAVVNRLAPEHLELLVRDPWAVLGRVHHAGAIFLGHNSPEPVGDYWAGPNHILPTNGTARFSSPLGVDDFLKHSSVIAYSATALARDAAQIVTLAESEGLGAHAAAVRVRVKGCEAGAHKDRAAGMHVNRTEEMHGTVRKMYT